MNGPPPPQPPPHGESPKTTSGSNMPPGKYDIFIIPPHSSGSGFLYLPSLKPNVNSFAAGFASALVLVLLCQSMAPFAKAWWHGFQGLGNMGLILLIIAVGVGAWTLGRIQHEGNPFNHGGGSWKADPGWGPDAGAQAGAGAGAAPPNADNPPPPPPHGTPPRSSGPYPSTPGGDKSKSGWQQQTADETPKNAWEKAREETRRKEEERKRQEAEQKRKEELAKKLKELREKEARERAKREQAAKEKAAKEAQDRAKREQTAKDKAEQEKREKEKREREKIDKEQKEKEAKERELRESRLREAREKDLRERLERERALREKLEKEAKAAGAGAGAETPKEETTRKSTYAFSSVGERTNPWPNGRPQSQPASPARPNPNPTSAKRPPAPTAKTYTASDEDTYSYRPYDQPKQHQRRKSGETVFTESSSHSYAPSQSTARTTPPPSMRGTYSTKDPDKIVIKGVYCFMNQYAKTPACQLISGLAPVTDGLILRITTEGLFIDDDVRGVPQREWDVKAWTLKLMEVWCSSRDFGAVPATSSQSHHKSSWIRSAPRGEPRTLTGDDADAFLMEGLRTCKNDCALGPHAHDDDCGSNANSSSRGGQSGEWKQRGLHVLRATIRDQEGKRYLFVMTEEEGWKVAAGLQRLRRGTQARQLGIQAMTPLESRNTLEMLGWS